MGRLLGEGSGVRVARCRPLLRAAAPSLSPPRSLRPPRSPGCGESAEERQKPLYKGYNHDVREAKEFLYGRSDFHDRPECN